MCWWRIFNGKGRHSDNLLSKKKWVWTQTTTQDNIGGWDINLDYHSLPLVQSIIGILLAAAKILEITAEKNTQQLSKQQADSHVNNKTPRVGFLQPFHCWDGRCLISPTVYFLIPASSTLSCFLPAKLWLRREHRKTACPLTQKCRRKQATRAMSVLSWRWPQV